MKHGIYLLAAIAILAAVCEFFHCAALFGAGELHGMITVLSSRPEMVTDESALIAVAAPAGAKSSDVKVSLGTIDVSSSFKRSGNSLVGLISGLHAGDNTVTATAGGKIGTLTLRDHDRNTPIISGPRQTPFVCQTDQYMLPDGSTLGPSQDPNCNAPTKVLYVYKPVGGSTFKVLSSTDALPADISTTKTIEGKIVNYIVRVETGTLNRAIYQYALLFDPTRDPPPQVLATYAGWNRKIVYVFGGGASAGYRQGTQLGLLRDVLQDEMLSRGFAVMGSTLNVFGNAANDVLSAETASMVKEKFIKTFGVPIYTLGWGGSGGAMAQYLIANNYPGILDGITPSGSFPDLHTLVPPAVDCALLDKAFNAGTQSWTEAQKTAVSGYGTWAVCQYWNETFSPSWLRSTQGNAPVQKAMGVSIDVNNCSFAVPKPMIYDSVKNLNGARCDIYTAIRNLVGIDATTGYAARGYDNVGVQYGLKAFQSESISADQFVDLNEKVGGYDGDGNFQAARTSASTQALNNLYEFGRVNEARNLANIPIIDYRIDPGRSSNIHDSIRSFIVRARLSRSNGSARNQVILRQDSTPLPLGSGGTSEWPSMNLYVLLEMDKWLSNIKSDKRPYPSPAVKVMANRPEDLTDACVLSRGQRISEPADPSNSGQCGRLMPAYADPRLVAGEPLTEDVLKCQLKPLQLSGYPKMSGAQIARLKAVFPSGVCDYSKPGVGSKKLKATWLSYPSAGVAKPLN